MSGIFGVISKSDCTKTLFYGVDYHSHLGTEYGGMVVLGDEFKRQIHNISQTQFKSKFYEDHQHMKGNKGIGVISDYDEQPIYLNSKFGAFCIVTAGLIENKSKLKDALFQKGISFSEVCPGGGINTTELIAKIISTGKSLVDGIERMFDLIEGSCTLLILTKEGIYAARDRRGYTPLVVGEKDGEYAVASESSSLLNLDFKLTKYIDSGEILFLTGKGMEVKRKAANDKQICSFLWIYTGFPASHYEDINVEQVRERCGAALAKRDSGIPVDVVAGIPDSGIAHAIGYANEAQKPYRRPLIKYTPGYGRSYTPPDQETRDLVATMKLLPVNDIIKGNSLVILDDSIVRGTQLKNYTVKKLWNAGAEAVHIRLACPPLMYPCKFCLSTRSINELAARKAIRALEGNDKEDVSEYLDESSDKYAQMIEWIRKDINVTTLKYQTIDDMVAAIGLPKEKLCTYCWSGQCPPKQNACKKDIHKKCACSA